MDIRDIARNARELIEELTDQKFDAISLCEKRDVGWLLELDVVEAAARLDDDDLLTAYRMEMTDEGQLISYRRLGRHKRYDSGAAAA